MSDIRVTYSGLIALGVGLISAITGVVFTLIVTRRLSPEEFGIWSIIGNMINYFLVAQPVITYWSTRQIARGEEVGSTALYSSIIFSLGSVPGYLVLSHLIYGNNVHLQSMIMATLLLPLSFVSLVLEGINLGHKPHANSYALLIFESLKIPVGLLLVVFFGLGINGAIFATVAAFCAKIVLQLYLGRHKLKGKLILGVLLHWIKLSWMPLYNRFPGVLWSLDVVVYSIVTHSVIGVAYYAASLSVSQIINNAGLISQALYPKLLAKGSHEHIKENMNRLIYFSILFVTISMIFAKPALFALNPAYVDISIIAIIFAARTFFYVITTTIYQILLGIETIDEEQTHEFSKIVKSKLFLVPTLQAIHYGSYIIAVTVTLVILYSHGLSQPDLVTWWVSLALVFQIGILIYTIIVVRKHIKIFISIPTIGKYVAGAIILSLVYFITSPQLIVYKIKIFDFLPYLIIELLLCTGVYFVMTYLIDKNTRILFKSVFKEFIGNKQ